jgi:hypothetical protein
VGLTRPEDVEELEADALSGSGDPGCVLCLNPQVEVVLGFPVEIEGTKAFQGNRVVESVFAVAVGGGTGSVEETGVVSGTPVPEALGLEKIVVGEVVPVRLGCGAAGTQMEYQRGPEYVGLQGGQKLVVIEERNAGSDLQVP